MAMPTGELRTDMGAQQQDKDLCTRTEALTDVCQAGELGKSQKGDEHMESRRKCSSQKGNQKSDDDNGNNSSGGSSRSDQ